MVLSASGARLDFNARSSWRLPFTSASFCPPLCFSLDFPQLAGLCFEHFPQLVGLVFESQLRNAALITVPEVSLWEAAVPSRGWMWCHGIVTVQQRYRELTSRLPTILDSSPSLKSLSELAVSSSCINSYF